MNIVTNFQIEPEVDVFKKNDLSIIEMYKAIDKPEKMFSDFVYTEEPQENGINKVVWKPLFDEKEWNRFLMIVPPLDIMVDYQGIGKSKDKANDVHYADVSDTYIKGACTDNFMFSKNTFTWQLRRYANQKSFSEILDELLHKHDIEHTANKHKHLFVDGKQFGGLIELRHGQGDLIIEGGYFHFDFDEERFRKAYTKKVFDKHHGKGKKKELIGLKKHKQSFSINHLISDLLIEINKI